MFTKFLCFRDIILPKERTMADKKLKYYNMIIHLVKNNKLYEENAAIKNVWEKDKNIFFDIYFYSQQKSYVFDSVFIHDILDLSTDRYYKDVRKFLEEFKSQEESTPPVKDVKKELVRDNKILEPLYSDLVMMTFIAAITGNVTELKARIILDYIRYKIPESQALTEQYIKAFLKNIKATENMFFGALRQIIRKAPDDAEELLQELLKISLSDGQLMYLEKRYLAEVIQILREEGLTPDIGL